MSAPFWLDWPIRDRLSAEGYVYVIEYSTGAIKVGRTQNPRSRIGQLQWGAAQFGANVVRGWLSDVTFDYEARERELIAHVSHIGERIGAETFRAPYAEVVAAAQARVRTYVPRAPVGNPLILRREQRRTEAARLQEEGFTYRQIAEELGCGVATVHNDLSRPSAS